MTDTPKNQDELSIGPNGLTIRGAPLEDVRAPLKRAAKTADSILRLLDNVVGLPADYISTQLEKFRERYREELEKIPEQDRQQPSLRTGCSVLRHVAYAADEPEIQIMFAKLLATASDKNQSSTAHPGFASVINDMKPVEAKLLLAVKDHGKTIKTSSDLARVASSIDIGELETANNAISNLVRLGLLEWFISEKPIEQDSLDKIIGRRLWSTPRNQDQLNRLLADAVNDLQQMKNSIVSVFRKQSLSRELRISSFGKQFIGACIPKADSSAD